MIMRHCWGDRNSYNFNPLLGNANTSHVFMVTDVFIAAGTSNTANNT